MGDASVPTPLLTSPAPTKRAGKRLRLVRADSSRRGGGGREEGWGPLGRPASCSPAASHHGRRSPGQSVHSRGDALWHLLQLIPERGCQKGKKRGQSFSKESLKEKKETSLCRMIPLDNGICQ